VKAELTKDEPLATDSLKESTREDVDIIDNSLSFVHDLLATLLDTSRAADCRLKLHRSTTNLLREVLRPVGTMLYTRGTMVEVTIDCPEILLVHTDRLRLKQLLLSLARNSLKFVHQGYVRLRAEATNGTVLMYVEDSGPGIVQRDRLFQKFETVSMSRDISFTLCVPR